MRRHPYSLLLALLAFILTTTLACQFLSNVISPEPTPLPTPQPTSLATESLPTVPILASASPIVTTVTAAVDQDLGQPVPSNYILETQMACDVIPVTYDPVGVTDTFAPFSTLHTVVSIQDAPNDAQFRVEWYADNVSGMKPNTLLGAYTLPAGGTRNLDFSFTPDDSWTPGDYSVDIYANEVYVGNIPYSIRDTWITAITLAEDADPDTNAPINPTTLFTPSSAIHAVVETDAAPPGTDLRVDWIVVAAPEAGDPDSLIRSIPYTAEGGQYIDFTLTPDTSWPAGVYGVNIYENDVWIQTLVYTVQ